VTTHPLGTNAQRLSGRRCRLDELKPGACSGPIRRGQVAPIAGVGQLVEDRRCACRRGGEPVRDEARPMTAPPVTRSGGSAASAPGHDVAWRAVRAGTGARFLLRQLAARRSESRPGVGPDASNRRAKSLPEVVVEQVGISSSPRATGRVVTTPNASGRRSTRRSDEVALGPGSLLLETDDVALRVDSRLRSARDRQLAQRVRRPRSGLELPRCVGSGERAGRGRRGRSRRRRRRRSREPDLWRGQFPEPSLVAVR